MLKGRLAVMHEGPNMTKQLVLDLTLQATAVALLQRDPKDGIVVHLYRTF